MRILLTGRNGQVGWELERILGRMGELVAFDREGMDLADPDAIVARVRDVRPALIVNPAAYTAVDKAESEPQAARAVNARAPEILAEQARRRGALLVHYSTDYVFDGRKSSPYTESDPTGPLSVYGATKLEGEEAIRAIGCRHLVLRTCWVYAGRGRNFLLTMLRLASERPELRVVNDQIGCPTWCRSIAAATVALLERRAHEQAQLLNLACSGEATWFDFARAIVEGSAAQRERQPILAPIATREYPLPARRPANSRLDCEHAARLLGEPLAPWDRALGACLAELAAASR